ncbi:MAG: tetratricopeptide repeat protein [Bacteroidota bacterium]
MDWRRATLLLFLLLVLRSLAGGQLISDPKLDIHIQKGIEYVYNLSFDSAQAEFQTVVELNPDHPAGHFFLAMVEWWKIMMDIENESRDEKFYSMLGKVIDICDKRLDKDENDVAALFFKGGAAGYRGRLHANRDEWLKAANDGRIALPIVQRAYQLAPDSYDILLGIGIYNYYAAVIPEQYPVVKPLMVFFPGGDKLKGIHQLQKASEKATYANVEASYFLLQLLFNYEKDYFQSLPIAERLYRRFPNNVVFHRYLGRCQAAIGRWEEMHQTFFDILVRVGQKKPGYNSGVEREAHYYLGMFEMTFHDNDAALQHFYRCDELSRTLDKTGPSGFMVMANLKIGMICDLQSKRDLAVDQYNKVLKMTDYQDAHSQAEKYLKTPFGKF